MIHKHIQHLLLLSLAVEGTCWLVSSCVCQHYIEEDLISQSIHFVPWGKLRNNNHLRNIFIKAKENKGLYGESNANILKNKKQITSVIVGPAACDKTVTGEAALTIWSKGFFTWTVLFDLVLVSSQYCFSTHGNLFNERTKVKRKIKHYLMTTSKGTLANSMKKQELWFIKEH